MNVATFAAVDHTLGQAADVMRDRGVRLLPILDAGRPVGLLSERDVSLAELLLPSGWEEQQITTVMSGIPYCVSPDATVSEVAQHLAIRCLEAAVVMVDNRIVGLFSVADALILLANMAGAERVAEPLDDDVVEADEVPPTCRCSGMD